MYKNTNDKDDEPIISLSAALLGQISPVAQGQARLTGVISRILTVGEAVWAEIAVDGAPDLFREIRVPYPLQNEDGTVSRFNVGDSVSIFVKPGL